MAELADHLVRYGGWGHAPVPWIHGRQVPTLYLCQGERVLHIGCADNLGLEQSLPMGRHLHSVLEQIEPAVLGIDIDADAIDLLRAKGLRTVEVLDITSAEGQARAIAFRPTVLLLPEVIEHIDDAGRFLRALCTIAKATQARLVLTTPNAFSAMARHHSTKTFESVNPDHRYFFSRSTLQRLLESAGWDAQTWWGYTYHAVPRAMKQATPPGYAAFAEQLRGRFPALDRMLHPGPDGRLVMAGQGPWWRRFTAPKPPRYGKPFEYDGLIVVAQPLRD